jgi:tRNA modification GTPase
VLLVMDGAEPLTPADRELMDAMPAASTILVINKDDLPAGFERDALAAWGHRPSVRISAKTGAGLDALRDVIADVVWGGQTVPRAGVLVTNVRHRLALEHTREAVDCAARAVAQGLTEEYVASDIREALDALGEILGVTLAQDIIDRIFENFCIGK